MFYRTIKLTALGVSMGLASLTGFAADQERIHQPDTAFQQDRLQDRVDQQDSVNQRDPLITPEERTEFRTEMQSAQTPEERQAIRAEHHEIMQERAEARGVTLPDTPRAGGMRPDRGGAGFGGGRGMGAGGGRGR